MHCIIYEIMKVFVIEWRFVWWIGKYWKVLESIVKCTSRMLLNRMKDIEFV